jgi:ATP-binding cassette subfamily B protein
VFLLNDTVAANIRFYDDKPQERLEEAAKAAAIHDLIMSLPQGYDTVVGERGVLLSAGQRQRIIIARVLAREPQVLILDEATSALDNESEAKIQRVIAGLRGKLTVIVIAHRLSTVLGADRIIAFGKGRVVEQGEPKRLLADPASYFQKAFHASERV